MIRVAKAEAKTCWYCEKPRSATARRNDRAVCASCNGFMKQGVICIGVGVALEQDTPSDKTYRDGHWCVLSLDEYTNRFCKEPPKWRVAFVTPEAWRKTGLPKVGRHGASYSENAT
ncbi:hypothetical protein MTR72_14765 [Bradyrhizobium sp. ISRA442]|uniref:hypothetical protein n=1 Tax=Bradyrhizobium sp. ISRA442 TaxID=2866197 RepID=UPI00311ACA4E